MKQAIALMATALLWSNAARSQAATNPCTGVSDWRKPVCQFVQANLKHSAWGYEHSLRDYTLAKQIAANAGLSFDDEALFAASMLHDIGGFPNYQKPGVDHAIRSTEVIAPILANAGFPMEKLEVVKAAIRSHSYYDQGTPTTVEAKLLHDADCLDFLGNVSSMRILAIVGHEPSIPTVKKAVELLESLNVQAAKRIYSGPYAQELATGRAMEMKSFLTSLKDETFGFGMP